MVDFFPEDRTDLDLRHVLIARTAVTHEHLQIAAGFGQRGKKRRSGLRFVLNFSSPQNDLLNGDGHARTPQVGTNIIIIGTVATVRLHYARSESRQPENLSEL